MPYKLIGHIPCGTEACTTATHSSSECNSVNGNINVDLTPVAKEATLLSESQATQAKIDEIVTAYNNGQETIDQMVAIQLQTIIGGEE